MRRGVVSFDNQRMYGAATHPSAYRASECDCEHVTFARLKGKPFFTAKANGRYIARSTYYSLAQVAIATTLLLYLNVASSLVSSVSEPLREGMKRKLLVQDIRLQNTSFRQPRTLQIDSDFNIVHNSVDNEYRVSGREIHVTQRARRKLKSIENSKKSSRWRRDPAKEGDCELMHPWQETSFPSCSKLHEVDMVDQLEVLIANGGYNSVFKMTDMDGSTHVIKILHFEKGFTERNFDRVRRESLIMERASASDYVVDIYSYCGFSQIVPYGQHGNLDDVIDQMYDDLSQDQKLQIATQVAKALADVHDLDGTGISSMTHGDFASKQYILLDGHFKLNDFNRGRLLQWNSKLQEPCPYLIGHNDGRFRSPEEYKYIEETAAIDVWALGSILVELVSGESAWHGYEDDDEAAQREIIKGKLPPFQQYIDEPLSDPINQVLLSAIDMCYVYEPSHRSKAGAVFEYLKNESIRLGVQWTEPFQIMLTSKQ